MKLKCMALVLLFLLLTGCGKDQTITFSAEIEKVSENSILVKTIDYSGFDKASVDLLEAKYDFVPEEGQIVEVTIKPEIRESYPVQTTGVKLVYKGEAEGKLADYFPIRENVKYVYEGSGNEFAGCQIYTDYISGDKIQQRVENGGTATVRVYELKDGKLTLLYSRSEVYYRENMLQKSDASAEVLLMEPLKKGTSWTLKDGRQRTITGVSKEIQTPMGTLKAIEVVTEGSDGTTVDYYAKGIGLIKTVFQSGGLEVSSTLSTVEEAAARTQAVRLYYPDFLTGEIKYAEKEVTYRTNDNTAGILEEAYKGVINDALGIVLSTDAAIKSLTLDEENRVRLDLNDAFAADMNVNAAFEAMVLQSIANTFGDYYTAESVILTVEGKPFTSAHTRMKEGQSIPVKRDGTVKE